MKKAGYPSGKYNGPPILTVADNQSPAKETAEAFLEQVKKIGFKLQYREVPHATMLTKFCQVPSTEGRRSARTSAGARTSSTPVSFFGPLFNGKNIVPSGNVNTAQVDDPKLNKQIDEARQITDTAEANKAWGDLDKEVTDQSYFVTWLWDNNVSLQGPNMKGVPSAFNSGCVRPHVQLPEVGGSTRRSQRMPRGPGAQVPGPLMPRKREQRAVAVVRYIIRRLLWVVVLLVVVSFITFLIFYVLPTADPGASCAPAASRTPSW